MLPPPNFYGWVILIALVGEWLIELVSEALNLQSLRPEVPEEFRELYDSDRYRKAQEYTRVRARFGLIPSTVQLGAVLTFWHLHGFAWLHGLAATLETGAVVRGLVFIGILAAATALLDLPFQWISTFVIEERFGFNRSTQKTFWLDRAKGAALAVVLGAPVLGGVLWLFESGGPGAWLVGWLATSAFVVALQHVAPTWLLPLFNRFEALQEGELKERVLAYARSVDFPLEGISVMDGSKRSTKANAFFTGFGRRKRIALFDTLVEGHSTDELLAVLAHEIGHYKLRHVSKRLALSLAHLGILFALLAYFLNQDGLFTAFGIQGRPVYAGLVFFGLFYTPIELVLSVFLNALSRRDEYAADRYAARTTGASESLARALEKLSVSQLANLTPHPLYVTLHHSHPPVLDRVRVLRREGRAQRSAESAG